MLFRSDKLKPDAIIDLATLTGACVVALGHYIAGAITNNEDLMRQLQSAAQRTGERVWELPNDPDYSEALKGAHGDLQNIADGGAGTIIGGIFLEHFVGDTPWVHLDIAGTAWGPGSKARSEGANPLFQYGVSGVHVRTLHRLITES